MVVSTKFCRIAPYWWHLPHLRDTELSMPDAVESTSAALAADHELARVIHDGYYIALPTADLMIVIAQTEAVNADLMKPRVVVLQSPR